jgi:hypothetical protein
VRRKKERVYGICEICEICEMYVHAMPH